MADDDAVVNTVFKSSSDAAGPFSTTTNGDENNDIHNATYKLHYDLENTSKTPSTLVPPSSTFIFNQAEKLSLSPLAHVLPHLRIKFLHFDDYICVVDKPPNLRSVPGNADFVDKANDDKAETKQSEPQQQQYHAGQKRPRQLRNSNKVSKISNNNTDHKSVTSNDNDSQEQQQQQQRRLTPSKAWALAITQLANETEANTIASAIDKNNNVMNDCLVNLATPRSAIASIPRKYDTFVRYVKRSQKRIFNSNSKDNDNTVMDQKSFDQIIHDLYTLISTRQKQVMNAPKPTAPEESALGQAELVLSHYYQVNNNNNNNDQHDHRGPILYVVHRLDCATSGVMVFARTSTVASLLGQAWQKRTSVHKVYHALVREWPPLRQAQQQQRQDTTENVNNVRDTSTVETCSGVIDLPLAPSEYAIEWKVVQATDANGKQIGRPSLTKWKVLCEKYFYDDNGTISETDYILLELIPITGKTHQLRIHCAAVNGQGIVGDTLYSKNDDMDVIAIKADNSNANNTADDQKNDKTTVVPSRLCLHAHKLSFPHPAFLQQKQQHSQHDSSQNQDYQIVTYVSAMDFGDYKKAE